MLAGVLVGVGVALGVGALVFGFLGRQSFAATTAAAALTIDAADRRRLRLWPVLCFLIGVALIAAGLSRPAEGVAAPSPTPASTWAPTAETVRPYFIELTPAPTPTPTPSPTPRPTPRPTAAPATAPGAGQSGPQPADPTPRGPALEPSLSVSVSCSNGQLTIDYTAAARGGATLTSIRVSVDGRVVQQPSVSGRTQYSGSYRASAAGGARQAGVSATSSDGGSASRQVTVNC